MSSEIPALDVDSWYRKFHDLMPFRVREILLVSSPYDAFILEEDGRLSERIFTEYSELNLSSAPRITHVDSGAEALASLRDRRIDLVLTVMRLPDMDAIDFGRQVKQIDPKMPVVVLAFAEGDLKRLPGGAEPGAIDRVFLWTGDARILLAVIKLMEDQANIDPDVRLGDVRVIIVVEDTVRRYSAFLSLLYAELMTQSQSLVAEGVNDLHKLLRMRARPKVVLACSYEQAFACYQRFRDNCIALITDVSFPRNGVEDVDAGFILAQRVSEQDPYLAILLQSANQENAARALELGVHFVNKNSPRLLRRIRTFLRESLGFGEFIFRLPDRQEVGRARDMYEMEQALHTVPTTSIEYHATRNHFSLWLTARSMFGLAKLIRPTTISDFGDVEGLRQHLIKVLRAARLQEQTGVVTDFSTRKTSGESQFVRLWHGSLGGKSRGLAFASLTLARRQLRDKYPGLPIRVPRSVAIGTDAFELFLEENGFAEEIQNLTDDRIVLERFINGYLPEKLNRDLQVAVQELHGPLAVRSSTMLEDSHAQPFAGVYATYMLPNNHPNPNVRFHELGRAIKAVYASTYSTEARSYMRSTPYSVEEERMSVLIQEVVGQRYGERFYPLISGVARSHNYYPMAGQRPEQGIAMVALGLGHMVVGGGNVFRFAPGSASVVQHATAREYLTRSQTQFYALDLSRPNVNFFDHTHYSLGLYDLPVAEFDGTLGLIGSVYVAAEDQIRDTLNASGPRLIAFNNILKWNAFPLDEALSELLALFQDGVGSPVEIEFAVDAGDWGRTTLSGHEPRPPTFYVLQVRPQMGPALETEVEVAEHSSVELLCATDRSLGHGLVKDIRDVVYVRNNDLDGTLTPQVADEVGEMNAALQVEARPYMLIGPGRWGSSDAALGIPVKWSQISAARLMVETNFHNRAVEPSQGTHFFHNLLSFHIGYLTLASDQGMAGNAHKYLDLAWLDQQPAKHETRFVRHVRLSQPLRVFLDGRQGRATVLKPE